jgi:hypothetical protein
VPLSSRTSSDLDNVLVRMITIKKTHRERVFVPFLGFLTACCSSTDEMARLRPRVLGGEMGAILAPVALERVFGIVRGGPGCCDGVRWGVDECGVVVRRRG